MNSQVPKAIPTKRAIKSPTPSESLNNPTHTNWYTKYIGKIAIISTRKNVIIYCLFPYPMYTL